MLAVSFAMEFTENTEKIIVFDKYDSVIEANVAKTKLDAYGIPCFLTNEGISNLYPLPMMKGMEVRLHIFEKDKTRVREVLSEAE